MIPLTKEVTRLRLTSPEVIKKIMSEGGLRFNKSLGQNFLIDESVLDGIIAASGVNQTVGVIEVGPGIGTLTQALAEHAAKVAAIELDRGIAAYLRQAFASRGNVEILQGDALKMDFGSVIAERFGGMPVSVVANLPYYITTPLIMKFLENNLQIDAVTVMVQKEVAERLTAAPASPAYGALSVAAQFHSTPRMITTVPPHCFMPPPKVTSAVIRLDLKHHVKPSAADEKKMFRVVKAAFGQRRKTLVNALSAAFAMPKDALRALVAEVCGNENARGETLGIREFIQISEKIY
ncbi:MAG: 16S rRNA (adenine(1518)-N(6)/adenine(1519)-N(6))-dimethyltransferase RsmA [Clostridiales bacterium]|nr:16S rRNA (adenine(1518)-N(6)/adenine(1519)-N(6))-dimethyltransferase RsmA [Clostridiales bacterium]